ncbi:flagellar hook-basal body complex protein FliE [Pantoea sp. BAV 3049]|uniref:flagellar hook-basal body complex protein FliE n=1 Tax=Pantoea sp. BAV 3049 TaxID=2654188 RepID=UPI00131A8985|nr:flagellar hook-basal body complex protein FliE [Pantoea sp. BAV 3049]
MIEKLTLSNAAGQHAMIAEMERMRAQATASALPPMANDLASASVSGPGFGQVMEQAVNHVDNLQHVASAQQRAVELGLSDDLASAMLESQKASVAFSALMQVRNKLSSAFDEVMNISL